MTRVRTAVLPTAGLGTRVLPASKATPKNLLNVFDRPILSYVVAEARAAGIEHIVIVTGRGQNAIQDYFDRLPELEDQLAAKGRTEALKALTADLPQPGEMSFVRQMAPLGLGHAVWCARDIVGDAPFAVMLPDTAPSTLPRILCSSGTSMYSKPLSSSSCLALAQKEQPTLEKTTTWSGRLAFGAT